MSEAMFRRHIEGSGASLDEGADPPEEERGGDSLWTRLTRRGSETSASPEERTAQERNEKTGGSLGWSSLAAVGAVGLGISVGLGKVCEWMMAADFDAGGINTKNKDMPEKFKEAFDWLYSGNKKAA